MTTTEDLIQERKKTHGDWMVQSMISRLLKEAVARHDVALAPHQLEALEMICVKMSRICSGNPNEPDHWNDIMGYARLGRGGHE